MNIILIKTTWAVQRTLCTHSIYLYIMPILANLRQNRFFGIHWSINCPIWLLIFCQIHSNRWASPWLAHCRWASLLCITTPVMINWPSCTGDTGGSLIELKELSWEGGRWGCLEVRWEVRGEVGRLGGAQRSADLTVIVKLKWLN